ncbi:UNVERIFIED_CONTAM: Arachidonate 5-lipoxygenase [Siphonaria sp. JEL0065]|nr:Arachidonate 5-lipoxygenase [Siphonaria sp. JEL0065]
MVAYTGFLSALASFGIVKNATIPQPATTNSASVAASDGSICNAQFVDNLSLPSEDSATVTRAASLAITQQEFLHVTRLGISKGPGGLFGSQFAVGDQTEFYSKIADWENDISARALKARVDFQISGYKVENLDSYNIIYDYLDTPKWVGRDWSSDEFFGRARMTYAYWFLQPISKTLPFAVTDAQVAGLLDDDETLESALNDEKLYVVDHSAYFALGIINKHKYHLTFPVALFYYSNKKEQLMPIAIQIHPVTHPELVFTPNSGSGDWLLAKLIVNGVDFWRSNDVDHFIDTHIAIEPIQTSKFRTLAPNHPVNVIVSTLMKQNTGIVASGQLLLLTDDGVFELNAASTLAEELALAAKQATWSFFDDKPVTDPRLTKFPAFKYLNLHYEAIYDLVKNLINIYYDSDEAVKNDHEVQAFAHDASSFFHGNIAGFPKSFHSKKDLIDTLALLQYKVSVRHHAYNSFTFQWAGGFPLAPWAFYKPIPTTSDTVTLENIIEWLPPIDHAARAWSSINGFFVPLKQHEQTYWIYNDTAIATPKTACALKGYRDAMDILADAIRMDKQAGANELIPWTTLDPHELPSYVYI